jgi:hypothetical protein
MSEERRARHKLLLASLSGVVLGFALGGCGSSPTAAPSTTSSNPPSAVAPQTTTTTAAPAGAPCTKSALTTAIMASPNNQLIAVNGFGCSGGWAWAGVTLGPSTANSIDAVMVLNTSGGSWQVADRATACNQHLVPAAIYNQACTTS